MIIFFVNLKKLDLTPKNDFGIRGSFFENLKMAFLLVFFGSLILFERSNPKTESSFICE